MPEHRIAFPRHAAQAVAALPRAPTIATTLDLPLQLAVERMAAERLETLPARASLALLVADLRTREIRAPYAGEWGNERRDGALDLTRRLRSPGLGAQARLYALAFQEGLASPDTPLADLPRHFGGYAPENFDRTHAGQVTAAEALRRSLNLPAVALMDRLGPTRFAATLAAAGIPLALPPNARPSLPLALGGAGITLRALAGLYAALGDDGAVRPLRLTPDEPAPRRVLVQPSAARLVADVLTEKLPDGGPDGIAWKTGTSWGGRDAWALGFDAAHVAAAWVGRPDGTALPAATGRISPCRCSPACSACCPPARARRCRPPISPRRSPMPVTRSACCSRPPAPCSPPTGRSRCAPWADAGRSPSWWMAAPVADTDPARRRANWAPPGPGFYTLSVLDADGMAAKAAVRVR